MGALRKRRSKKRVLTAGEDPALELANLAPGVRAAERAKAALATTSLAAMTLDFGVFGAKVPAN